MCLFGTDASWGKAALFLTWCILEKDSFSTFTWILEIELNHSCTTNAFVYDFSLVLQTDSKSFILSKWLKNKTGKILNIFP